MERKVAKKQEKTKKVEIKFGSFEKKHYLCTRK